MFSVFRESFFSFSGQVSRANYWYYSLAIIVTFIMSMKVVPWLLNLLFDLPGLANPLQELAPAVQIGSTVIRRSWMYVIVMLPLGCLLAWSLLSIAVRRLRDRGRPIWLVLPLMVLPLVSHLAYWVVNLFYPFTVSSSSNMPMQVASWSYDPEYLFPRGLMPAWSLLELSGARLDDVYEQVMKEIHAIPSAVCVEQIARISIWFVCFCILIPAACLSAWASIELGVLGTPTRTVPRNKTIPTPFPNNTR